MSDRPEHLEAAGASLALAGALSEFPERPEEQAWTPTILYHVAVQLFEAAEAGFGLHYVASLTRISALSVRYPDAAASFRKLRQLSEVWRYQGTPPTNRELDLCWVWARQVAAAVDEPWPEPIGSQPDAAAPPAGELASHADPDEH